MKVGVAIPASKFFSGLLQVIKRFDKFFIVTVKDNSFYFVKKFELSHHLSPVVEIII
jgi:hypothetical protein